MRKKGGFDYILLETTGLADPGKTFFFFFFFRITAAVSVLLTINQKVLLRPRSGKMRSTLLD